MKKNPVSPVGALHPILFFAGVYIVALFFSIFICSSIFYSCNTVSNENSSSQPSKKVNSDGTLGQNTAAISINK